MPRIPSMRAVRGTELRDLRAHQEYMAEREARIEPEEPVRFAALGVGDMFGLRHSRYVGVTFVKTAAKMSQIYSWDEHSQYQSFDPDTMVYERKARRPR